LCKQLERELGTVEGWTTAVPGVFYIYVDVESKELQGCIILESRPVEAYKAKQTQAGQEKDGVVVVLNKEKYDRRCQCAVRLMWTSSLARRKKIASKLLDCARAQVLSGQIVPREHIAFSQPTQEGNKFIQSYIGSPIFFVYGSIV